MDELWDLDLSCPKLNYVWPCIKQHTRMQRVRKGTEDAV